MHNNEGRPLAGAQVSGGLSELANGHSNSGDLLQAVGGLRFSMQQPDSSGDLRAELRNGDPPHAPGSPSTSGRGAEPAALSRDMQHGRSESLGSDTHLPVGHAVDACVERCLLMRAPQVCHAQGMVITFRRHGASFGVRHCPDVSPLLCQALAGRLGSGANYGADPLRPGESPRILASQLGLGSVPRGQPPGYR